jgi:hypothetical protein
VSVTLDQNLNFGRANLALLDAVATYHNLATTQPFTKLTVAVTGSGLVDVTGLASPVAGQIRCFLMVGAGTITVKHEHAGSTAANRWHFSDGLDRVLTNGSRLIGWYDDAIDRWRDV